MQCEANKAITLAKTRIRFDVKGQCVDSPAKVILRLLPRPRLVIKCELDLHNLDAGLSDFQQECATATIHDQEVEFIVGQFSFPSGPDNTLVEMSLLPKREPISIHYTGDSLSSVEFGVLNFPDFNGEQDNNVVESDGSFNRIGAASLQADHFVVDIEAASNLSDLKKELAATGGYGITHFGTVRRSDGNEFRVSEVEQLLSGLSLFLSFARGAYCGLTLIKGKSRGEQLAWECWGSQSVTGWFSPPSWFDTNHGHLLAEVFPGFWHLYKEQEKDLRVVITLYLDSNLGRSHGVGLDGGLILTQAALERMARKEVGKTGKRIARALRKNRISEKALFIPPDSCPELTRLATKHGWKHGPHALVEIRNSVVHPRQNYGEISAMAFYEAWNLGQWYLELTFLSLFGACGEYSNRLTKKWVGEVEPLCQWLVKNRPHITEENE